MKYQLMCLFTFALALTVAPNFSSAEEHCEAEGDSLLWAHDQLSHCRVERNVNRCRRGYHLNPWITANDRLYCDYRRCPDARAIYDKYAQDFINCFDDESDGQET